MQSTNQMGNGKWSEGLDRSEFLNNWSVGTSPRYKSPKTDAYTDTIVCVGNKFVGGRRLLWHCDEFSSIEKSVTNGRRIESQLESQNIWPGHKFWSGKSATNLFGFSPMPIELAESPPMAKTKVNRLEIELRESKKKIKESFSSSTGRYPR